MSRQANPYPLRIEKDILDKSKYIAKINGRSLNKDIEFILKNNIIEFEKKYGEITTFQDTSIEQ